MKFFVFTLLIALFVSLFYGRSEAGAIYGKPILELSDTDQKLVENCSFNSWDLYRCSKFRHCRVVGRKCEKNEQAFKNLIPDCDLPTPKLCKQYSHCFFTSNACLKV